MITRELARFLVVGTLTVLVDYASYRGLIWLTPASVDIAKALGFIAGTVFAYFANRFWTFGHKEHAPGSAWRFVLLYATTLGLNVLVNASVLRLIGDTTAIMRLAFLLATGTSATLNFIGMKWFVFKERAVLERP